MSDVGALSDAENGDKARIRSAFDKPPEGSHSRLRVGQARETAHGHGVGGTLLVTTVYELSSPASWVPQPASRTSRTQVCDTARCLQHSITAGGRLLLVLLERVVTDAGGTYLLCDTDSMAIVASELGEPVPCVGGPHRLPDDREAIKALSWAEVRKIVEQFNRLNPYDRSAVRDSILKIEDVKLQCEQGAAATLRE